MRKISRRARNLAVGASLLALAAPVLAQKDPTPSAPPAAAGGSDSGEIIVTAQRRNERLRDVPISITALSADTLTKAGVTNTLDLSRVAVGVEMPMYGGFVRPSIRGISSGLSSLGDSSNVALYIDGVYQPSESGQLADLPDVQSVQILKGPQGSLYGQNAGGGAIIVDTLAPSFKLKGLLSASYGNYNDKAVRGYITGPLSSTIAVAVSGSWEDRDGFNRDLLRGGHDTGLRSAQIRGKLLWQPSPNVSFTVAGYYTKRNDSGVYTGAPLNGNSSGNATILAFPGAYPGVPVASKPHTFAENFVPATNIKSWGISLLGKIGVGDIGTINTVTAYQKVTIFDLTDTDESAINIGASDPLTIGSHDFIQEVNFISNKIGRLTISAGLFFMKRQESYDPQLFKLWFGGVAFPNNPGPPNLIIGTYSKNNKLSYAGYVEANFDITDTLTVTAAGRYSYEKQKAFNSLYPDPSMYPDPRGYFHFAKFTPRAVLRWKINNDNTVYASYSQGFKSGLVDNSHIDECPGGPKDPSCLVQPVKPETITAFEIGYKARLFGRLNFSLAAFHYNYKNIQVFIYNPVLGTGGSQNAAGGHVDGAEFEGTFNASHDLNFNFGVSYLKTKYTSFPDAQIYFPTPAGDPTKPLPQPGTCFGSGLPFPCGNTEGSANVKGNRLVHAPSWTANLAVDYLHEFAAGRFGLNVSGNYDGGFFFDPNNRVKQKPYALLNAELSFAPTAVQGLRFVLWGKNLTNHNYIQSMLETNFADAVSWAPPRTFGGRIEFQF